MHKLRQVKNNSLKMLLIMIKRSKKYLPSFWYQKILLEWDLKSKRRNFPGKISTITQNKTHMHCKNYRHISKYKNKPMTYTTTIEYYNRSSPKVPQFASKIEFRKKKNKNTSFYFLFPCLLKVSLFCQIS